MTKSANYLFRAQGKGSQGGERWRGRLPIPEHVPPLVRGLFVVANERKVTIKEIALTAGLRAETVSAWRYRREPTVSNLVAALNVLGLDLAIVPLEAG